MKIKAHSVRRYVIGAICTFFLVISFNNCAKYQNEVDFGSGLSGSSDPTTASASEPIVENTPASDNNDPIDYEVVETVEHTQTVTVSTENKVDVLVVVDNSGSMANEQQKMGVKFGGFLSELKDLDWQLGIITTDISSDAPNKDGRFLQFRQNVDSQFTYTGQYILDSKTMTMDRAQTLFSDTVQRTGANEVGSGNEQGIAATYRAIERSQSTQSVNSPNINFFRKDSTLAVIVVSDENETFTNTKNQPDSLITFVGNTFTDKKFIFHSIVIKSDDITCFNKNKAELAVIYQSSVSYGKTYEELSTKTGGVIGSVCETDYASQLSSMGKATVEAVKEVTLECSPVNNADGTPNLTITTADGSPSPSFEINDKKLTLSENLPAGTNTFKYNCLN